MQMVRVRLVRRSKYGSLVFNYSGCSNAIVRENLASNIIMRVFWYQVNKGLNKREIKIVGKDLGSEAWANILVEKNRT